MTERPILFSAPMVRAILAGEKTQTRRVVRFSKRMDAFGLRPDTAFALDNGTDGYAVACEDFASQCDRYEECPYGLPGGRLWVRETWEFVGTDMNKWGRTHRMQTGVVRYIADATERRIETDWQNVEPWMKRRAGVRPSIHMPRWASRITLELTAVRVERLQDITEDDAIDEGCGFDGDPIGDEDEEVFDRTPRGHFAQLWDSLNAKRGYGWDANPWVWVLEFTHVDAPGARRD